MYISNAKIKHTPVVRNKERTDVHLQYWKFECCIAVY